MPKTMLTATSVLDTRYAFAAQFLEASAIVVRSARDIERMDKALLNEQKQCEYRGLVTSVIMQCAAALETEAQDVWSTGQVLTSGLAELIKEGNKYFFRAPRQLVNSQQSNASIRFCNSCTKPAEKGFRTLPECC